MMFKSKKSVLRNSVYITAQEDYIIVYQVYVCRYIFLMIIRKG